MFDPGNLETFAALVSPARFETYLRACRGRGSEAVALYAWNIEATAAFWGPLSVFEVVLRNAIHDALREGRRDDWWHDPGVCLLERDRAVIDAALANLARRGVDAPSPGQVVAATTFALWVGLTDEGIPRDPYLSYEVTFWQPRLCAAFPHAGRVRRKQLHRSLDEIRFLRNRLAHHEPVFRAPLIRLRDDLVRVAGFIHPDAAELVRQVDRVDEVVAARPG